MRALLFVAAATIWAACSSAPAPALPARVADPQLASLVDAVMDSTMAAEHIPGAAVVVVQDGRMIFSKGYGLANLERRTPVDPATTRFRIGSISKALTSLA